MFPHGGRQLCNCKIGMWDRHSWWHICFIIWCMSSMNLPWPRRARRLGINIGATFCSRRECSEFRVSDIVALRLVVSCCCEAPLVSTCSDQLHWLDSLKFVLVCRSNNCQESPLRVSHMYSSFPCSIFIRIIEIVPDGKFCRRSAWQSEWYIFTQNAPYE